MAIATPIQGRTLSGRIYQVTAEQCEMLDCALGADRDLTYWEVGFVLSLSGSWRSRRLSWKQDNSLAQIYEKLQRIKERSMNKVKDQVEMALAEAQDGYNGSAATRLTKAINQAIDDRLSPTQLVEERWYRFHDGLHLVMYPANMYYNSETRAGDSTCMAESDVISGKWRGYARISTEEAKKQLADWAPKRYHQSKVTGNIVEYPDCICYRQNNLNGVKLSGEEAETVYSKNKDFTQISREQFEKQIAEWKAPKVRWFITSDHKFLVEFPAGKGYSEYSADGRTLQWGEKDMGSQYLSITPEQAQAILAEWRAPKVEEKRAYLATGGQHIVTYPDRTYYSPHEPKGGKLYGYEHESVYSGPDREYVKISMDVAKAVFAGWEAQKEQDTELRRKISDLTDRGLAQARHIRELQGTLKEINEKSA